MEITLGQIQGLILNEHFESNDENIETVTRQRSKFGIILRVSAVLFSLGVAAVAAAVVFIHPEKKILILHGSTTVGDVLAPKLAEAYLKENRNAYRTGSYVAGQDKLGHKIMIVWGDVPSDVYRETIEIFPTGSGDAFKCLASDAAAAHCDIGMSSRPMNGQDLEKFPKLVKVNEMQNENVIAFDAIDIVVNSQNPITQITLDQVKGIFLGEITNWKELGGADAPIVVYGRDHVSGTGEMFSQIVLGKDANGKQQYARTPPMQELENGTAIVNAVMQDAYAIGYSSSQTVHGDIKALDVADASGTFQKPTEVAIVSEDYPISRKLFLYHLDSPNARVNDFIDFVMHDKGQSVVADVGYIALTPKTYDMQAQAIDAPVEYRDFATKYKRLGVNFRFSSGKLDLVGVQQDPLDNPAQSKIKRLLKYLNLHPKAKNSFMLVGYSDNTGESYTNYLLALARANNVKTTIESTDGSLRIPVEHVLSFGQEMPVAQNTTTQGRYLNRRVEVWVPNEAE